MDNDTSAILGAAGGAIGGAAAGAKFGLMASSVCPPLAPFFALGGMVVGAAFGGVATARNPAAGAVAAMATLGGVAFPTKA